MNREMGEAFQIEGSACAGFRAEGSWHSSEPPNSEQHRYRTQRVFGVRLEREFT